MNNMYKIMKYISILTITALLLGEAGFLMPSFQNSAYAQETDSTNVLTVFTEPDMPTIGDTSLTESGLGLDTLVSPSDLTGYNITWKSSDTDAATVDDTGHVHGMLTGKYKDADEAACTITATVEYNGKTSSDSVTVKVKRGYDPTYIVVDPALTLSVGETQSLDPKYDSIDDVETREEFFFISQDPSIAFVDEYGDVTGISPGTAIVTMYTLTGLSSSCTVTVDAGTEASGAASTASTLSSLSEGTTANELLICYDSKVTNKTIKSTLDGFDAECEAVTKNNDDEKIALASCSETTDIDGLMDDVKKDDSILYVQPNYRYKLYSDDPYYKDIDTTASSPYSSQNQYFHFQSRFSDAWDLMEENGISGTTTVGLIDSGVNATHKDLTDNLILNNDGSYTVFLKGKQAIATSDQISTRHGTHISGIIGATYGNGICGAGAASGRNNSYSKVLMVGVVDSSGSLTSYDIIKGIDYAVNKGAKVINMSFGGPARDRLLGTTIKYHYYNNNVVFVGAAGNDSSNYAEDGYTVYDMCHPADMKEVIGVCNINCEGSTTGTLPGDNGTKTGTNFGFAKDISAPGHKIYSTGNAPSSMKMMSGTSMAAPVVSSACALILDADPDLKPWEVRNILCGTAKDPSSYFKANELGYGELDAYEAVKAAYAAKESSDPESIYIKIKEPYSGNVITKQTVTTVKGSLTKPAGIKYKIGKTAIKYSFTKPTFTLTKNQKVIAKDMYTGKKTIESDTTTTSKTKAGVKYKIGIKKKGGSWKYYKFSAASKNKTKYSVTVKGNRITVKFKKLKRKTAYYVRVRAYKQSGGKTYYSNWTAKKKIKTK